jgi:hypothetical protein
VRAFRAFDAFAGAGVRALRLAIMRNVAYATLVARKVCEKLFEDLGFGEGLNLDARITRPFAQRGTYRFPPCIDEAASYPSQHPGPTCNGKIVVRGNQSDNGYGSRDVMSRLSCALAELPRSGRSRFREPQSTAVLIGGQRSKRGVDIKAGVPAAHSTRASDDRENISLGSRCRPATLTICTMPILLVCVRLRTSCVLYVRHIHSYIHASTWPS